MNTDVTSTEVMLLCVAVSNILGWVSVLYLGITQILAVWLALGVSVGIIGARYQTIRVAKAWSVWVPITVLGLSMNYITYREGILAQYGFIFVWLISTAIGYTFISVYNREDNRLGKYNRIQFAISGVVSVALLIYTVLEKPSVSIRVISAALVSVIPSILGVIIYRRSDVRV